MLLSNLHKLGVNSLKCSNTEGLIYFYLDELLCVVVLGSEFRTRFVSLKKNKINKSLKESNLTVGSGCVRGSLHIL